MGDWRRSSGSWEQGWSGKPARHGRPPHPPGHSYISVPSWEKRFCTSVCTVPWRKICEAKDSLSIYKNVADWNDSAALDAFQNAKSRYWAESNGLPCDIPLPDPNMYIDKVDYYAVVDPELVSDLYRKHQAPEEGSNSANGWDSFVSTNNYPIRATGWDGAEDSLPSKNNISEHQSADWNMYVDQPVIPTGWDDAEYSTPHAAVPHSSSWGIKGDSDNTWNAGSWNNRGGSTNGWTQNGNTEHKIVQNNSKRGEWDNSWNNSTNNSWTNARDNSWNNVRDNSWNNTRNKARDNSWSNARDNSWNNTWNNSRSNARDGSWNNSSDNARQDSWGTSENKNTDLNKRNDRKRHRGGHLGFRPPKSRYQEDNYQNTKRRSDGGGRDIQHYSYGNTMHPKQPLAMS